MIASPETTRIEPPPPGVYRGVPFEDYARWDAWSQSVVKVGAGGSMAHVRHARDHSKEPTPEMEFGEAVHCAMLEPERFRREYVVEPPYAKHGNGHLTKEAKEQRDRFRESYPGAAFLSAADMGRILGIAKSLSAHPIARPLIAAPGEPELSLRWDDAATGLPVKARVDRVIRGKSGRAILWDYKSTDSVAPRDFERVIGRFRYDIQAGLYTQGWMALHPGEEEPQYVILAVERDAPWVCQPFRLRDEDVEGGRALAGEILKQIAECERSGVWPGFSSEVLSIGVPPWAERALGESV